MTARLDRGFGRGSEAVYRRLRWALEDAIDPEGETLQVGNPGRGNLAFLPRAKRTYAALVFTVEQPPGGRFDFLASYVLSRSYGNYAGLYDYSCQRCRAQPIDAIRLSGDGAQ